MYALEWASVRAGILTIIVVVSLVMVQAQVMTSSNYQIQSDSINSGGLYASSSNYQLESTVGEVATGESSSASYELRAGYQQMQEIYLAITAASDVTMSSAIGGVAGGTAVGSTSVTVTTDNLAGYELKIVSSGSPAMQSDTDTIADYTPVGNVPDYNFTYDSSEAVFAFTVESSDAASRYLSSGGVCGSGSDELDKCWDGPSTTARTIATASASNHPSGLETTIQFQVGIGSAVSQSAGTYVATTTLTALPL